MAAVKENWIQNLGEFLIGFLHLPPSGFFSFLNHFPSFVGYLSYPCEFNGDLLIIKEPH